MRLVSVCLGYPVYFAPKLKIAADSRGVGPWKRIVVGPSWSVFEPREKAAIIMHEVGHCRLRHLEKRIASLWLLFWRPRAIARLCRQQEYEADDFARANGYGADLMQAFLKLRPVDAPLHPRLEDRVERLARSLGLPSWPPMCRNLDT